MDELIFEDWKQTLDKLYGCISKDLDEIREQKEAMQQLKTDYFDKLGQTKYIRDDNRIVLSAPEIIIGNVDSSGDLWTGQGSKVIIRGNDVSLEATGDASTGGVIRSRAASIQNIAVDPGIDGREDVLLPNSEIVNHARTVTIQSNDDKDCFAGPAGGGGTGVNILSDTSINIRSNTSTVNRKNTIEDSSAALKKAKDDLKANVDKYKKTVGDLIDSLSKLVSDEGSTTWGEDLMGLRGNGGDLLDECKEIEGLQESLYAAMTSYIHGISELAEINRKITALDNMKNDCPDESSFTKSAIGSSVSITGENISLMSVDGDGNYRNNPGAGFHVQSPHISLVSNEGDGKLMDGSTLNINSQNISVSTNNTKMSDEKNGDIETDGLMDFSSKNFMFTSVDYKINNEKVEENKLAAGSNFFVRTEAISFASTDKEGKATGRINLNAKDTTIKAMDIDPKDGKDKSLSAGSNMLLLAEKMFVGSKKKDIKSKSVQISSEKVGIMAKDTAEMQQGEGKAVLTLDGGNATLGGSKNELKGDTTIGGKADIKGDATMPKATVDNLEAKTSFKSSNISDGIAAPKPSNAEKPSAKITEEEMTDNG